ncbi:DUF502 domain-containing protein [Rhodopseudomonas sp. WA056]|uniref:DUF502 domain-containing protein n=1 Tax=Rhodopseudomonas palustris (strain DX-1) TaxID=652103 RepID=E6VNQ0_RHOPX|nr:DUF502 domain-containing protein [Rhodopseudomonas sp. WA056]NEW86960.1 DUF502 domain-containing protein [Rhodopseudomonas sp. WA056]
MLESIRRNVLTGLLTIVPLWITLFVIGFVVEQIIRLGRPLVVGLSRGIQPYAPDLADLLTRDWFHSLLAVVIGVGLLFAVGAATNAVVGRRFIRMFDQLIKRVPLVKTIYGASRTLIDSMQRAPQGGNGQRVVLIQFPNPDMRTVGFVTAVFEAVDTGEELAAVYVPTAPNPTSGYVEIVPTKRLVWLDWSANDAMAFIVSGGTMTPGKIRMNPNPAASPAAASPIEPR